MLIIIALQIRSKHAAGSAISIANIETILHASPCAYISPHIAINFLEKATLAHICVCFVPVRILPHDH